MTRLEVGAVHDYNGGSTNKSLIERLGITINSETLPLNYTAKKARLIASLARTCGFSDAHTVRKIGNKKLTISGILNDVGLMIWFGNQHFVFKHFINFQLLFDEGKITSAVYITSTKEETINRLEKIRISQGKKPSHVDNKKKSALNYNEFETTVEFLEAMRGLITVPITVIGLREA